MKEIIWAPVERSPHYWISDTGCVLSFRHGPHFLKNSVTKKGYERVYLGGRCVFVHGLVAYAFLEPQGDRTQVNHIDCNKRNNRAINLEWCDQSHNMQHAYANHLKIQVNGESHGRAKLKLPQVKEIRQLYKTGGYTHHDLAARFGISKSSIGYIIQNKTWNHHEQLS